MSSEKYLCPRHQEDTPSCVVYRNAWHCFGCGANGPLSELGLESDTRPPEPCEDLEASLRYIQSLPRQSVRGLSFHADHAAYYLVWPGSNYYKARYFDARRNKYRCPKGHDKPLFIANSCGSGVCLVVEGEINALSVAQACPEYDVVSPGSATEFTSGAIRRHLGLLLKYNILYCISDNDGPGAKAVIGLMGELRGRSKCFGWQLMDRDANETLVQVGQAALRAEVVRGVGAALERCSAARGMPF